MQKYHDEPKQYKGYLKSALVSRLRSSLAKSRSAAAGWQGMKSEHIGHM